MEHSHTEKVHFREFSTVNGSTAIHGVENEINRTDFSKFSPAQTSKGEEISCYVSFFRAKLLENLLSFAAIRRSPTDVFGCQSKEERLRKQAEGSEKGIGASTKGARS